MFCSLSTVHSPFWQQLLLATLSKPAALACVEDHYSRARDMLSEAVSSEQDAFPHLLFLSLSLAFCIWFGGSSGHKSKSSRGHQVDRAVGRHGAQGEMDRTAFIQPGKTETKWEILLLSTAKKLLFFSKIIVIQITKIDSRTESSMWNLYGTALTRFSIHYSIKLP